VRILIIRRTQKMTTTNRPTAAALAQSAIEAARAAADAAAHADHVAWGDDDEATALAVAQADAARTVADAARAAADSAERDAQTP
jgi:hypothetical protein